MKSISIILGLMIVCCSGIAPAYGGCVDCLDPNNYIDDPNNLENGLFECGEPNLTSYDFTPPTFWERIPYEENTVQPEDCYVAQYSSFIPVPEPGHRCPECVTWTIPYPYEGNYFAILSTGDMHPFPDSQVKGSMASQKIFLSENDTIVGAYFFGTCDYPTYSDSGRIYLEYDTERSPEPVDPNDIPPDIEIISIGVNDPSIGQYGSTDDWVSFTYTIEPNQVGPYFLKCSVEDGGDNVYKSYLAVDGFRICRGGDSPADLDMDCDVDLSDYSILSSAWLAFCPDDPNGIDPNDITSDPNIPCQLADIDNSWLVDPNDLVIMSEQWLINASSE